MLSTADIARMRATAELAMTGSAQRQTKSTVSDGGGGNTGTYANSGSALDCRLAPVGGGEGKTTGGRVDERTTHVVTLPAGTTINEADRLVISGATYEVLLVRTRDTFELTRRVEVRKVQ